MADLAQLKKKWFLDVSQTGEFPGHLRHPATQVKSETDGNLVEWLIDGKAVMEDFYFRVKNMIDSADPTQYQLWIASWKLDPVKLLGNTNLAEDAEELILKAASAGVQVYYLGSGHVLSDSDATEFGQKIAAVGGQGASDTRFPLWGSHHQKFNVFGGPDPMDWAAVVGSVDLSFSRWDTPSHEPTNDDRKGGPTHDLAVVVKGPALHDIAQTFAERWNDSTNRQERTSPTITNDISTSLLESIPPQPNGPHSVQVLRTYPIAKDRGYSWSNQGEFTVWAAYLKAIKQAQKYIYVEDQYFYTFNSPPATEAPPGDLRDSDIVYQLGEALKRGVDIIILVADLNDDPLASYQRHQRRMAAHYLRSTADSHPNSAGRFVICSMRIGGKNPIVHSKLMIVDDEFVLIGNANIGQRSMSYDSELHLGIVDADSVFAQNLRLALWKEHLELDDPSLVIDSSTGASTFESTAANEQGRLRHFPADDPGADPIIHEYLMNWVVDPYGGPHRH